MRTIRKIKQFKSVRHKLIIFIPIILLCVIAICIGIYAQFFYKYAETDKFIIGNVDKEGYKREEIYEELKNNFNDIFTSTVTEVKPIEGQPVKIDEGKELVYTANEIKQEEEGKYDIDVNFPVMNIKSQTVDGINKELQEIFLKKVQSILEQKQSTNAIYTIKYAAYINGDVISLIIEANLKESTAVQRQIVKTYNYSISQDKVMTVYDAISGKGLNATEVQNKINKEIKIKSDQVQELKKIGYNVFERNPEDSMYQLDQTDNFFIGQDGYLYILYPYGNKNFTSELDIIIF